MIAAGSAGNYGLDRMLERKGVATPGRALAGELMRPWKKDYKTKLRGIHVPYSAGRVASTAVRSAGIPLAAYGAFNIVRPGDKVVRVRLKDDVLRPTLNAATGLGHAKNARSALGKADLTSRETDRLGRRKQVGRDLSIVGGTLGLGALALRAPEAARAVSRVPRVGRLRALKALAARDSAATKASNALGVAAIGVGSVGSFNYAAQQKLERKQVVKSLYDGMVKGLGRVRVVERTKPGYVTVYDSKDVRRFMPESRVTPVPKRRAAASTPPPPPSYEQLTLFGKRDDRFLRQYRDRISPEAERGYEYLRSGRNRKAADSALSAGFAGLSAGAGLSALRSGSKGWAALGGAGTALSGYSAVRNAKDAKRWDSRMGKIKAKARERAALGEYGRGRQVPVGKTYVGGGVYRSLASLSPKAQGTVARNIRSGSGFGASPQQRAADTLRGLTSRQPNPDVDAEAGRRATALVTRRARKGNATSTSVPGLSVDARMPAGVRSIVESQAAGLKLKGPTTVRWNKEKKMRSGTYPNYTVDSPGPTGRGRTVVLSANSARGADPKIARHELEHAVGGARKGRVTSLRLRRMPNRSLQNEEARADAASMSVGGKRRLGSWYPNVFGDRSQYGRRFREITGRKARPHSVETYRRNTIASVPEYKSVLGGKEGKGDFYRGVRQGRENAKIAPDELTLKFGEYARRASRQGTRDAVGSLQRAGASERLANRRDFFGKGLFPIPRPRMSMMPRRPSVRSGYTGTSRLGRKFTVRGSVR